MKNITLNFPQIRSHYNKIQSKFLDGNRFVTSWQQIPLNLFGAPPSDLRDGVMGAFFLRDGVIPNSFWRDGVIKILRDACFGIFFAIFASWTNFGDFRDRDESKKIRRDCVMRGVAGGPYSENLKPDIITLK